jgi:very-short-patch-repair endonuclease
MSSALMVHRARRLRRRCTHAEHVLWQRLRNRRLGGFKFYRQRPLHGRIADFYNHDANLVVEVDGESHFSPEAHERDRVRDAELLAQGYATLRISNADVLLKLDEVCTRILDAVYARIEEQRVAHPRRPPSSALSRVAHPPCPPIEVERGEPGLTSQSSEYGAYSAKQWETQYRSQPCGSPPLPPLSRSRGGSQD